MSMHTVDPRHPVEQALEHLLLTGIDLKTQVIPIADGISQLRITTTTGATGSARFDEDDYTPSEGLLRLIDGTVGRHLRVANVTAATHAPLIDMLVAFVVFGWSVSVQHQQHPDGVRDAGVGLRASPPPGEGAKRLADALLIERVAVEVLWDLVDVDGDRLVTEWGFAWPETGLRVDSTIREYAADALVGMAIAGAADWSLPNELNVGPSLHSRGDAMPSSSISDFLRNFTVVQPTASVIDDRRRQIDDWARAAGFDTVVRPATTSAVSKALTALGRGTAGYYVLEFDNGQCYVGQSVSIAKRLGQHQLVHRDIVQIRVQADPAATESDRPLPYLLGRERELIHDAQNARLVMRNRAEMTVIPHNGQPLDRELLSPELRRDWIGDPIGVNRRDLSGKSIFSPTQRNVETYRDAVATMLERAGADAAAVMDCIHAYVTRCLPIPLSTEYQYWTLSTPKVKSRKGLCRLSCVSVGFTEVLTIFAWRDACAGIVQVSATELWGEPGEDDTAVGRFYRNHPGVEVSAADYKDSGPDNVVLHAPSIKSLALLLDDTTVTRAAATAALNLMRVRKSGDKRKESHNPHLAGVALGME